MEQRVRVVNQWSRWRRDWLWGSTIFTDPAKSYVHEGVPVSQLGFPVSARLRMLPWVVAYYGAYHLLMRKSVRHIARSMGPFYEQAAGQPDVIHGVRMGREFLVQAALSRSRKLDVPFVLTPLHHPRWRGPLYRVYDEIYRQADAVIALTDEERQMLITEKGIDPSAVHVTGIGPILSDDYSVESFRAEHDLEGPFVLFLGRHVRHKGYEAILKAAPRVWRDFPELQFVFVGAHTSHSEAVFAGCEDARVRHLGTVDLSTKTAALAACEFLCLPSTQESFGGVYTEAWVFGKPVIGGDIPPIACVIDDGENGLLSSQEAGELSEKMLYLLEHPARAKEMGESGKRKVERCYTWEQIARRTLEVYRSVL